jgi:surface polysaccharide O-acyltransferase-like enzyme
LLALTVVVFVAAILRRPVRWKWRSIVAMVLISVGQFAGEISTVGVPGIWFPFGVGVSRTQFVYVGFFVAVVVWMRRAVGGARKQKMAVGAGIGGGYSAPF